VGAHPQLRIRQLLACLLARIIPVELRHLAPISHGSVREGDPKGWSTVLVTALGSVLRKPIPRGHSMPHSPS
jgi:hypothetical protein